VVGSWTEHERQHARFTARDQARLEAVQNLGDRPATVTHWLTSSVSLRAEAEAGPIR
jgi:hypothetical protein